MPPSPFRNGHRLCFVTWFLHGVLLDQSRIFIIFLHCVPKLRIVPCGVYGIGAHRGAESNAEAGEENAGNAYRRKRLPVTLGEGSKENTQRPCRDGKNACAAEHYRKQSAEKRSCGKGTDTVAGSVGIKFCLKILEVHLNTCLFAV